MGLLSTSVQSLGLTLQRKSHILEDEKAQDDDDRRPPYRRRRWQLGMGMFIVANLLGSTIQITTLPLPVLSTLQASGLVFNSICATLLLAEPFTRWSFVGTFLVCAGAIMIAIFGAIPEPAHTLTQLLDLLQRRPFVLWMIGQAMIVVIILVAAACLSRCSDMSSNPRVRLSRGLAFGCISGILSAHSLLVAKSAVELLVRTIVDGVNQFNKWQAWAIIAGLIFLALTQLYYLHQGLKLVSTSVLYPLVFCIYNIVAILDGLIYFRQMDKLSLMHGLLIALGTVILLSGVLALSWRINDEQSSAPIPTALAPGLGYVEETDEEYESEASPDDEAEVVVDHIYLLANEPMTPTTKQNTVLGATRAIRKKVRVAETRDEIWNELDDSTPRRVRRNNTFPFPAYDSEAAEEQPNESTALLRRSDVDVHRKHRRRRSTGKGFPGFIPRSSPRGSRRRSSDRPQSAIGGLFKMKWWNNKKWKGEESRSGTAATEIGSNAERLSRSAACGNRNSTMTI